MGTAHACFEAVCAGSKKKIWSESMQAVQQQQRIRWFVPGDINGFFGLAFDNVAMLAILSALLLGAGFDPHVVFGKIFPGTALGVLFGDTVYFFMGLRLAKRTGNPNVTSMPLGLDTPSTIGLAVAVLIPVFVIQKGLLTAAGTLTPEEIITAASTHAWYVGMATMVFIGIFKSILAFLGPWIQKIIPQAALLGSLAGIGFALLGFIPLVKVFSIPVVGILSLGIILYTMIARAKLPKNLPGVFMAALAGAVLYYILGPLGLLGVEFVIPTLDLQPGLPLPSLNFLEGMSEALAYLPIALPFALLTSVGGINVTASARAAGDDYNTRNVLLVDAMAAFLAGICGGVVQTTPYIGQPAYKAMGSRVGYVLLVGLFVGIGGMLGAISFIVKLIPEPALAPILIFVALEIITQAFKVGGTRYIPAIAFACLPTISNMVMIKLTGDYSIRTAAEKAMLAMGAEGTKLPEVLVVLSLGNGFIISAMLWGAAVIKMIDRKLKQAALCFLAMAGLSFFGFVHSAMSNGSIYLPWNLEAPLSHIPYQFTAAYIILAMVLVAFSYTKESKEPFVDH
jgi:AGZA family xanthine/uracil permease-like MFS transporter